MFDNSESINYENIKEKLLHTTNYRNILNLVRSPV